MYKNKFLILHIVGRYAVTAALLLHYLNNNYLFFYES